MQVIFEGPSVMHFSLRLGILGELRQVKTILPVEPFKQQVEVRWFAERGMPLLLAHLMAWIGKNALLQDKQVWENKLYHKKPMLVCGDGPFPAFMRWYGQFYSESSEQAGANTDW